MKRRFVESGQLGKKYLGSKKSKPVRTTALQCRRTRVNTWLALLCRHSRHFLHPFIQPHSSSFNNCDLPIIQKKKKNQLHSSLFSLSRTREWTVWSRAWSTWRSVRATTSAMSRGHSLVMNGPDPLGPRLVSLICDLRFNFSDFTVLIVLWSIAQVVSSEQDNDEQSSDRRSHGYGRNQWNGDVWIGLDWFDLIWFD